jgi:hypothetical protein
MAKFQPGNKGGPGRPRRRTEDQYLRAMVGAVTLTDWRDITDKAIAQAKRGDSRARQWLSDYLLGKPTQQLDVTSGGESFTNIPIALVDYRVGIVENDASTSET